MDGPRGSGSLSTDSVGFVFNNGNFFFRNGGEETLFLVSIDAVLLDDGLEVVGGPIIYPPEPPVGTWFLPGWPPEEMPSEQLAIAGLAIPPSPTDNWTVAFGVEVKREGRSMLSGVRVEYEYRGETFVDFFDSAQVNCEMFHERVFTDIDKAFVDAACPKPGEDEIELARTQAFGK